jgi:hypothetical protein
MNNRTLPFLLFVLTSSVCLGQSTYQSVYQILNSATCGSALIGCHSTGASSGLDFSQSETNLYQSLYLQNPNNAASVSKRNKLVYPGDPYRSLLFRKINNGLAANVDLVFAEGDPMPLGNPPLSDEQIELVRQWLIWGAPETGQVADLPQISAFYNGQGMYSVENPPQPPAEWEGFQIRLGPFFLNPGQENVTPISGGQFARFDAPIDAERLIHKIKSYSGFGQHHYTLFSTEYQQMPYGITGNSSWFNGVKFLATAQNNVDSLLMPSGAGISIQPENPLIVNLHVFNPSTSILAADIYLNVYTQDPILGLTELLFSDNGYPDNPNNPPFTIPSDGQPHTFEYSAFDLPPDAETRYVWSMLAHSHGTTTENAVYLRNANGTKGDMIYDTGCPEGTPCPSPFFDPEHIANRYFNDWLEVDMTKGFIQSGTFVNTTGQTLNYGPNALSAEMLVFGYYYVLDTAGLGVSGIGNSFDESKRKQDLAVYPNPSSSSANLVLDMPQASSNTAFRLELFDGTGRLIHNRLIEKGVTVIELDNSLFNESGIYLISLSNARSRFQTRIVRLQG